MANPGKDMMEELGWDPAKIGQKVRIRDKPGRQGVTTGKVREAAGFMHVQVEFGPNDKSFKMVHLLEPIPDDEEMLTLLANGRFGGPRDLLRVLTFEKIRGDLTNVFYSMEASNTEFYTHQFRPVLKFIESPVGRLLLADEVGLGKTIESIYIWKELQAREYSRRLLIVCPAMLRNKWQDDLRNRFNIYANIISSQELLQKIQDHYLGGQQESFQYIVSLEALRPPSNYHDEDSKSARAQIACVLDDNPTTTDIALFDLVIFDEAHYLRNPYTANNRLARLMRDASHHMLLLTATPIQIANENLFQLMRLVDPEQFDDHRVFQELLDANAPVVRALQHLWRAKPNMDVVVDALEEATSNQYFRNDPVLERVKELAGSRRIPDKPLRIELARQLEARSLLSQYMTRSRAREVLENRVERRAQVLRSEFSDVERKIYEHVTRKIREKAEETRGIALFALIARQRQMASSLVAAIESWKEKGLLDELLWEDMGRSPVLERDGQAGGSVEENGIQTPDDLSEVLDDKWLESISIAELERVDDKYRKLKEFISDELTKNLKEKFIVFAFFRRTLTYLSKRLIADGIKNVVLMGGMGSEKDDILTSFRSQDGPSVLLSSEVGSEGLDLQFCRVIINYDLPWNPMKVEQRIGRIDRLGQKAEKISIINLSTKDTIEDRILLRLYERIKLFEKSIGDLEPILGETTEQLMEDLINPNLTDAEREKKAEDATLVIINRRHEQDRLEAEAVNLFSFADFILESINESREKGRWLSSGELMAFVEDFFYGHYSGTKLESMDCNTIAIMLPGIARDNLSEYIQRTRPSTHTRLHQTTKPILCHFNPREAGVLDRSIELIEPTHPLIRWIRDKYYERGSLLHPVSAIILKGKADEFEPGQYVYVSQRWSFMGLRSQHQIMHQAIQVETGKILDVLDSEGLINAASRGGIDFPNAANQWDNSDELVKIAEECNDRLWTHYEEKVIDFEAENKTRSNQQKISAEKHFERRISTQTELLNEYRAKGNEKLIPPTLGRIRKAEEERNARLARIERLSEIETDLSELAVGIIQIEA